MKKLLVLALMLAFIIPATATVWGPGPDPDRGGGSSGGGSSDPDHIDHYIPADEIIAGVVYFVPDNLSVKRSADFVNVLYMEFFNRVPDKSGYNNNLSKVTSGTSRASLVVKFAESGENTRLRGGTSDSAFLTTLYNTLLRRNPDTEGLNAYYSHMRLDGWSREKVAQKFLDSDEYASKHVGAP